MHIMELFSELFDGIGTIKGCHCEAECGSEYHLDHAASKKDTTGDGGTTQT